MQEYKYKIDKKLLDEFCLLPVGVEPTPEMLEELNKVLLVVFIKHYSNYIGNADLEQECLCKLCEIRTQYDPSYPAYNWIYTTFRNTLRNVTSKMGREVLVDDLLSYDIPVGDGVHLNDIPPEIRKWVHFLTGEQDFDYVGIPKSQVLDLYLFLRFHDGTKHLPTVPDFVTDDPRAVERIYRALSVFFQNDLDT